MRQVATSLLVLLIVFGAGVLTGRASLTTPDAEGDADPSEVAAVAGSEALPIALGEQAIIGPWTVRVADVDLDAADQVLSANQFNTPPQDNTSFVLVDVVVHRRAGGPGVLRGDLDAVLTTPAGGRYPLGGDCGVLRHPLDVQQPVGAGQELAGQWCWSVPVRDVPKVALRVGGTAGGAAWFALR